MVLSERLVEIGKLLGRAVRTPQGQGILIGVYTPSNSLYYVPEKADLIVWYGFENNTTGILAQQYRFDEVSLVTDELSK